MNEKEKGLVERSAFTAVITGAACAGAPANPMLPRIPTAARIDLPNMRLDFMLCFLRLDCSPAANTVNAPFQMRDRAPI